MVGADPCLSVLVLTEDNGKDAFATVQGLTKKLLVHLDERCQTQRISFEPANEDMRGLLAANQFTNRRDSRRRRLYQIIAAQLRLEDGFVVHHVDADRTWKNRERSPSPNAAAIQTDILDHVRALYRLNGLNDAEIDANLSRFFRLVPYWEIEAWLYQNTERALGFCQRRPDCDCPALLAAWRRDRALLDEQPHPSDLLCFGKRHNHDLLHAFPTADVIAAGKSLAAAIDPMLACDPLLHAIERTYHAPPTPAA